MPKIFKDFLILDCVLGMSPQSQSYTELAIERPPWTMTLGYRLCSPGGSTLSGPAHIVEGVSKETVNTPTLRTSEQLDKVQDLIHSVQAPGKGSLKGKDFEGQTEA